MQCVIEKPEALKILQATVYPKATDHIPEMISMIDQLIQKDLAYPREGSVYFRVKDFKTYGQLSRISLGSNTSETEDHDEYDREHARDFVLWKAAKSAEPFWNSPWGPGRPGWHIECSAMGLKVLGEHIDLHSGGVDLIFPHHENEIAQSDAGVQGSRRANQTLRCVLRFSWGIQVSTHPISCQDSRSLG